MDDISKILTEYADKLSSEVGKTADDSFRSEVDSLVAALRTETVEYCDELAPAATKYNRESILVAVKKNISAESIQHVSYILAQIFLEHYILTGRLEDSAPVLVINNVLNNLQHGKFSFHSVSLMPVVTRNMLQLDYERMSENVEKETSGLDQLSRDVSSNVNKNIEELLKSNEALKQYQERFNNLRSEINFTLLGKAFTDFIANKKKEKMKLYALLAFLSILILYIPFKLFEYSLNNNDWYKPGVSLVAKENGLKGNKAPAIATADKGQSAKKENNAATLSSDEEHKINWNYIIARLFVIFPVAVAELILIFYFKIVLGHFNSTGAQLLQLEMRLAVCQFIENFVKFKKDTNVDDLDKFESLIFSNLMPSADQIPPTFDGLEQLGKVLGELKAKG